MSCASEEAVVGVRLERWARSHRGNYIGKRGNCMSVCDGKLWRVMTSNVTGFIFYKDDFDVLYFNWMVASQIHVLTKFIRTYTTSMYFITCRLCLKNIFKKNFSCCMEIRVEPGRMS